MYSVILSKSGNTLQISVKITVSTKIYRSHILLGITNFGEFLYHLSLRIKDSHIWQQLQGILGLKLLI